MITTEQAHPATVHAWRAPSAAARNSALCTMPARTEAAPALRRFARDTARRWLLADDVQDALSVIVTELVTNVVLHSGSPDIAVLVSVRGTAVTIAVRDSGRWKSREATWREPLDAGAYCGRGLGLVDAYATRTTAYLTDSGTTMAAEIALCPPPAPVPAWPDRCHQLALS